MPTATLSPDDLSLIQSDAKANGSAVVTQPPVAPSATPTLSPDDLALMQSDAKANGGTLSQKAPVQSTDQGAIGGGALPIVPGSPYAAMSPNERHLTDLLSSASVTQGQAIEPFLESEGARNFAKGPAKPDASWGIPGTPIYKDASHLGGVVSRPVVNGITVATFGKGGPPRFYDSNGQPIPTGDPRVAAAIGAPHPNMQASDIPQAFREVAPTAVDQGLAGMAEDVGTLANAGMQASPLGLVAPSVIPKLAKGVGNVAAGIGGLPEQAAQAATNYTLQDEDPGAAQATQEFQQANINSVGGGPGGQIEKLQKGDIQGAAAQTVDSIKEKPFEWVAGIAGLGIAAFHGSLELAQTVHDNTLAQADDYDARADNVTPSANVPDSQDAGDLHAQADALRQVAAKIAKIPGVGQRQTAAINPSNRPVQSTQFPDAATVAPETAPTQEPVTATSGSLTGLLDDSKQATADIHSAVDESKAKVARVDELDRMAESGQPLPKENATPLPPRQASPIAPDVTPVTDRPSFEAAIKQHYPFDDEKVQSAMAYADGYARAWSKATGKPAADWYAEDIAGVGRMPKDARAPVPEPAVPETPQEPGIARQPFARGGASPRVEAPTPVAQEPQAIASSASEVAAKAPEPVAPTLPESAPPKPVPSRIPQPKSADILTAPTPGKLNGSPVTILRDGEYQTGKVVSVDGTTSTVEYPDGTREPTTTSDARYGALRAAHNAARVATEATGEPHIAADEGTKNTVSRGGQTQTQVTHMVGEVPENETGPIQAKYKVVGAINSPKGTSRVIRADEPVWRVEDTKTGKPFGLATTRDAAIADAKALATDSVKSSKAWQERQTLAQAEPLHDQRQGTNKGSVQFLSDHRAVIRALKNPDVSTVVHELAHVFRRSAWKNGVISDADKAVIEKWAGVKNGDWAPNDTNGKFDPVHEEKFARGFERYLADGQKAPWAPKPLQDAFDKFANWLGEIYKGIKGTPIDVDLTPEVRNVFDKILGKGTEEGPKVETSPDGFNDKGGGVWKSEDGKAQIVKSEEDGKYRSTAAPGREFGSLAEAAGQKPTEVPAPAVSKATAASEPTEPKEPKTGPEYVDSQNLDRMNISSAAKDIIRSNGKQERRNQGQPVKWDDTRKSGQDLGIQVSHLKALPVGKLPIGEDGHPVDVAHFSDALGQLNAWAAEQAADASREYAAKPTLDNEAKDAQAILDYKTVADHNSYWSAKSGELLGQRNNNYTATKSDRVMDMLRDAPKLEPEAPKSLPGKVPKGVKNGARPKSSVVSDADLQKAIDDYKAGQKPVTIPQAAHEPGTLFQSKDPNDPLNVVGHYHYDVGAKTYDKFRPAVEGSVGPLKDEDAQALYAHIKADADAAKQATVTQQKAIAQRVFVNELAQRFKSVEKASQYVNDISDGPNNTILNALIHDLPLSDKQLQVIAKAEAKATAKTYGPPKPLVSGTKAALRLRQIVKDARQGKLVYDDPVDQTRDYSLKALPEGDAEGAVKVANMLKAVERDPKTGQVTYKGRQQLAEGVSRLSKQSFADNLEHYIRANLLSNPATLTKIAISHLLSATVEDLPVRAIAAGADRLLAMKTGQRSVTGANLLDTGKAVLKGLGEHNAAVETFWHGENTANLGNHTPLHDPGKALRPEIATKVAPFNAIMRLPMRTHAAIYRMIGSSLYDRGLREAARLQAQKSGEMMTATELYDKPTPEMMTHAREQYQQQMFANDNLVNNALKPLTHSKNALIRTPANASFPFAKVPINISGRAAEYNPVGATISARKQFIDVKNGGKSMTVSQQANLARTIGRGVTGTALTALGYELYRQHLLNAASTKKHEFGSLNAGGRKTDIDGLGPISTPTLLGANIAQAIDDQRKGLTPDYAGIAKSYFEDQPILRTSENAQVLDDPGKLAQIGSNLLSEFIPYSSALRGIAAETDPTHSVRSKDGIISALKNGIPGLREQNLLALDVNGKPIAEGGNAMGLRSTPIQKYTPEQQKVLDAFEMLDDVQKASQAPARTPEALLRRQTMQAVSRESLSYLSQMSRYRQQLLIGKTDAPMPKMDPKILDMAIFAMRSAKEGKSIKDIGEGASKIYSQGGVTQYP